MKNLTRFSITSAYEAAYENGGLYFPNVSLTEDDGVVHYEMTKPYNMQYLTFEAKTSGTITIKNNSQNVNKTISYSIDNGSTWTNITTSQTTQTLTTLNTGDKLLLKANNTSYGYLASYYNTFGGTAEVDVYGNIMSLIYGDDFIGKTSFPSGSECNFSWLFNRFNIIDASNLILPSLQMTWACYKNMFTTCSKMTNSPKLPATKLASGCYQYMFQGCEKLLTAPELPATNLESSCYSGMFVGCTALTKAPVLPATTLVNQCYNEMFSNCTHLNYIKALFTTTPSTTYTSRWVYYISSTGTFVKNKDATWNVTGVDGIPSGWTIETE